VLGALISATHGASQEVLEERSLLHNCIFLLNAGHETTTNLIANATSALLDRPQARREFCNNPSAAQSAVEEFLRFESSDQLGNRRLLAPVQVGDETLPAGTLVTLLIGAANRDPGRFEEPDALWLSRSPNRHLAFAAGIHTCAGAALARMEARVALTRLFARFPALERRGETVRDRRARFRVARSCSQHFG
jgi:cytochrome P450